MYNRMSLAMSGVKVRTVGGFGAGELGCARLGGAGEMDQDIFSQLISQTHPAFQKTCSWFLKRSMRRVAIHLKTEKKKTFFFSLFFVFRYREI